MVVRRWVLGSMVACALACLLSTAAFADPVRVFVDGRPIVLDQQPMVENGRVLVPMRALFQNLGATVTYSPSTRHIHAQRNARSVDVTLHSQQAFVDGQPIVLDVPPQLVNNRTMVPLRTVSTALGAYVQWNAATDSVVVLSNTGPTASSPPVAAIPETVQPPPIGVVQSSVPLPTIKKVRVSSKKVHNGETSL